MIVFLCAVVVALVLIAPFFMEPGDRAMREKERRDCRDAFDQPFDGEMEQERNTETDNGLVARSHADLRPVE